MKIVIGIVGVKTSGKSTITNLIKKNIRGGKVVESALADKLKDVCSQTFQIPRQTFEDQKYKEIPFEIFGVEKKLTHNYLFEICRCFDITYYTPLTFNLLEKVRDISLRSPRHILQIVGTEVVREIGGEDIHCKNTKLSGDITIVSDIRFPNEYDYFKNLEDVDFIPIYVHRLCSEELVGEHSHSSEKQVIKMKDKCFVIDNNGTLEKTEEQLNNFLMKEGFR